ncbi:hypothetical protein ACIRS3_36895 [Streptomyces virginiae]
MPVEHPLDLDGQLRQLNDRPPGLEGCGLPLQSRGEGRADMPFNLGD